MSNKLFAALCVLGAVLLASQTVTCADDEQDDSLYIADVDSKSAVLVSDSDSPVLSQDRATSRRCIDSQCSARCRSMGFRFGRCVSTTVCRCTR